MAIVNNIEKSRTSLTYIHLSIKYLRIIFSLILITCPLTFAQSSTALNPNQPTSPTTRELLLDQQITHRFDFEEREIHSYKLPLHWRKVLGKKGFPHYSEGKLDNEISFDGQYSFKLISDGGSVGFKYDWRKIRVTPGSDYQISGYVHLEKAHASRARIYSALLDRVGKEIPGSSHSSELVAESDHDAHGWAKMQVYIPGNFHQARFLSLQVQLLQQEQWDHQPQNTDLIFRKDIHAVAWFDDITINQIPRVILRTKNVGNVFENHEPVSVRVEIEGVSSYDYQMRFIVRNAIGTAKLDESWVLTGIEGEKKIREIKLPDIEAGIYHAELNILAANKAIATRTLSFLKLGPLTGNPEFSGKGFGIIALGENAGPWESIMPLTALCNAKIVKLPVWQKNDNQTVAIFTEKNFDQKLITLQRNSIELVAVFDQISKKLALETGLDNQSILDILSQDVQLWRPQVAGVLAQYAKQVPYWQIGGDFLNRPNPTWDPRIRLVVASMRNEFDKLVSNTKLVVPLSGMFEIHRPQINTSYVALNISSAIVPQQIPNYLQDWHHRKIDQIWANIETIEPLLYNRKQVLIDFAKRIAYAKQGFARNIFIDHPWRQKKYKARLTTEPTELFLVFRTLADQLGGTRFVGRFDITPDIPALIFERNGQGCIVTWNNNFDEQSGQSPPEVQLYLGENPKMVDLFGNRSLLPTENGISRLKISDWPIIISDVNTRIAALRASLKISPSVIDANISRQKLKLKFTNPFNTPVSGTLRALLEKRKHQHWVIDPSSLHFILQPHEKYETDISLKMPGNELGGKKELPVFFTIDADQNYRVKTTIPFEIRLTGIDVNIFTLRANENDLLIQQVITNESEREVSLHSFIDLPDMDSFEQVISRMQPGSTVTKNFLVKDATQWLGNYIRVGLYDPKGTKRINYQIEIN